MAEEGCFDLPAALAALRLRGAPQADPVRWHFIESLARRAAAQQGALRRVLDRRLETLLQDFGQQLSVPETAPATVAIDAPLRTSSSAAATAAARRAGAPTHAPAGPLAALANLLRQGPAPSDRGATAAGARHADPDAGIGTSEAERSLQVLRRTWSRLRATQRLTQSEGVVPGNAGPLNSHHLVHRALRLMQALSPEYLHHFLPYVDSLLWLDRQQVASRAAAAAESPRPEASRKPAARPAKPAKGASRKAT